MIAAQTAAVMAFIDIPSYLHISGRPAALARSPYWTRAPACATLRRMKHLLAAIVASVVAAGFAAVDAVAQHSKYSTDPTPGYQVPRTPDGKPDLQGVWGNNSVTPMTRPRQWKDKQTLTDAEVEELKTMAARSVDESGDAIFGNFVQQLLDARDKGEYKQVSYDPSTGNYNQFWMAEREWDNRTSLIVDPPNGQLPPLTKEAEARRAAAKPRTRGPADGPEDRPLSDRKSTRLNSS